MKFKMLRKVIASATLIATLFSNSIVYAATTNSSSTATQVANSKESNSSLTSNENVLNVNVDDKGSVDYTVPVSAENREDQQFSWDNASVYFVMTDRFYNGDKNNDHSYGRSLKEKNASTYESRQGTFHGGDLKGLTEKLDEGYFDKLGVNAIWITAPYEQIHGALSSDGFKHYSYEGYYTLDYTNVDGNMGTADDLADFIDTAHTHGIRVVFDIVVNHAGYADPVTANEYGFGKLASNWEDIYYNWDESQYKWYNDYVGEAAKCGSQGIMIQDADWTTNWWGSSWVRAIGERFKGYQGSENSDDYTKCLQGLPDFKTESTDEVSLPGILKKKWQDEGRYDKETKELDDWFNKTKKPRYVKNYIIKWLTDWVREYGVDGFRCDTAKHVELSVWKELKDEANKALNEWRTKYKGKKPGAEWTDDFWMTAENNPAYVGGSTNYFSNGFDSVINFGFKPNAFNEYGSLDGLYTDYVNKINYNDNMNYLSYISSHDEKLSRGGDMKVAGTNLLLCPGAIQIFYGDETNRKAVGSNEEMACRSQMNWDSIDTAVLSHWQKVGTFRNNHIAVGAGVHTKLNASPYTFSRTYDKNGIEDAVVCCLPGKAGTYDVKVGDAFADGQKVVDSYSGKEYIVTGGSVSVTCDDNGVILLERKGGPVTNISATPGVKDGTSSYENTLDIKLNATAKATDTKYSLDGATEKTYTNGDTITIGEGLSNGDLTTLKLTAKNENGETLTANYTYKKIVVPYKKGYVYAKQPSGWGSNLYAYIYDESTGTAKNVAKWPGTPMTYNEEYGRYELEIPSDFQNDTTQIIFTDGSNQNPGSRQPGVYYKVGKAMVYDGTDIKLVDSTDSLTAGAISTDKSSPVNVGTSINITTTEATNGSGNYSYKFAITDENNNETVIKDYSDSKTATWTPNVAGTYKITVYTKDSDDGKEVSKTKSFVVEKPQGPEINSFNTNVPSGQTIGTKVTLVAAATGTGTVKYKFTATLNGNETVIKDYSTARTTTWIPSEAGNYTLTCYAKDKNGENSVTEEFEVTKTELKITGYKFSIKSGAKVGDNIRISSIAQGTGNIKYKYIILDSNSKIAYSTGYSSRTYTTWQPSEAGKYKVNIKVKDSTGAEAIKTINYEVKEAAGLNITNVTTSKTSPQAAGTAIKITANAEASSTVSYKFYVHDMDGDWTVIKNYSTKNSAVWTPDKSGSYIIWVDAKDESGHRSFKFITFIVK